VLVHRELVLPGGQVLPGADDEATAVRTRLPGSGSMTATDAVIVTVAPCARVPVQTSV
jgi:hypothetical protein